MNDRYTLAPEAVAFLKEIDDICKKYNLSISHEDEHGAFVLEKYDDLLAKWLFGAFYGKSICPITPNNNK